MRKIQRKWRGFIFDRFSFQHRFPSEKLSGSSASSHISMHIMHVNSWYFVGFLSSISNFLCNTNQQNHFCHKLQTQKRIYKIYLEDRFFLFHLCFGVSVPFLKIHFSLCCMFSVLVLHQVVCEHRILYFRQNKYRLKNGCAEVSRSLTKNLLPYF